MNSFKQFCEKYDEYVELSEAALNKADLNKDPQRWANFKTKIANGEPFKLVDGSEVIVDKNLLTILGPDAYSLPVSGRSVKIPTNKGEIALSKFEKTAEFGSNKKSGNVHGKKLADAAELATVKSLTTIINVPEDTEQQIFIDDPSLFNKWKNTFDKTRGVVQQITNGQSIGSFDIIHDATDKSKFTKVINAFCSRIGKNTDSWNPADIFLVKKSTRKEITDRLDYIVKYDEEDKVIAALFNAEIYHWFEKGDLYPISLKQIIAEPAAPEYTNIPGKTNPKLYNIEIAQFGLNLGNDTKEIGGFKFNNLETGKPINMQIRTFPHKYSTTQVEITNDGSPSGGRIGKVPSGVIDNTGRNYKWSRIKSVKYFGPASKPFSGVSASDIDTWTTWYTYCAKQPFVQTAQNLRSPKDIKQYFTDMIELSQTDGSVAANFVTKIQGLNFLYFFCMNQNKIGDIMNSYLNGAKKISADNGFFIKVT